MISSTKTWGGKWECEYVLIQSDGMKDIKFEVNKWFDPDSKVIDVKLLESRKTSLLILVTLVPIIIDSMSAFEIIEL